MHKLVIIITIIFSSLFVLTAQAVELDKRLDTSGLEEYVLGSGDTVRISVYGSPDLNTETRVTKAGSINFPLLGNVGIGGLTPAQAEKKIATALEKGSYVKEPHVNLVVTQFYSQFVSVLGNVYKPGRFSLDRVSTLSDALALAGGVAPNGSDIVTLSRNEAGETIKVKYDLREILSNRKVNNPTVKTGDIIYVPDAPVFYIHGEVQRPGSFKLQRNMTVAQALSTGGGLTIRGTERGIEIQRLDQSGQLKTFSASLGDKLQENDVIVIKESWF